MQTDSAVTEPSLIAQSVERVVRSRTGDTIKGLHVEIDGSDVLLTGRTSTFYCKQLATHAVLNLVASANLTNDIEVS